MRVAMPASASAPTVVVVLASAVLLLAAASMGAGCAGSAVEPPVESASAALLFFSGASRCLRMASSACRAAAAAACFSASVKRSTALASARLPPGCSNCCSMCECVCICPFLLSCQHGYNVRTNNYNTCTNKYNIRSIRIQTCTHTSMYTTTSCRSASRCRATPGVRAPQQGQHTTVPSTVQAVQGQGGNPQAVRLIAKRHCGTDSLQAHRVYDTKRRSGPSTHFCIKNYHVLSTYYQRLQHPPSVL